MIEELNNVYPQRAVRITDYELKHRTTKAWLVGINGKDIWIPDSQVLDVGPDYLDIPYWLAVNKEIV